MINTEINEHYEIETHDLNMDNIVKIHYSMDNWRTRKVKVLPNKTLALYHDTDFMKGVVVYFFEEILADHTSHFSHPYGCYDIFSRTLGFWIWYEADEPFLKLHPEWGKNLHYRVSQDGIVYSKLYSVGKKMSKLEHHMLKDTNIISIKELVSANYVAFVDIPNQSDIILNLSNNYTNDTSLTVDNVSYVVDMKNDRDSVVIQTQASAYNLGWVFSKSKSEKINQAILNYEMKHETQFWTYDKLPSGCSNIHAVWVGKDRVVCTNLKGTKTRPKYILITTKHPNVKINATMSPVKEIQLEEHKLFIFPIPTDLHSFYYTTAYNEYRFPKELGNLFSIEGSEQYLNENGIMLI